MEDFGDECDDEIQALWRQVEELTMHLEHREATSERSSSHNNSSDDSKHVNPFASRQTRNFLEWFMRSSETIKIDFPNFHGRL